GLCCFAAQPRSRTDSRLEPMRAGCRAGWQRNTYGGDIPSQRVARGGESPDYLVYLLLSTKSNEEISMHRTRLQYSVIIVISALLILVSGPGNADPWYIQRGEATWYGKQFNGR